MVSSEICAINAKLQSTIVLRLGGPWWYESQV